MRTIKLVFYLHLFMILGCQTKDLSCHNQETENRTKESLIKANTALENLSSEGKLIKNGNDYTYSLNEDSTHALVEIISSKDTSILIYDRVSIGSFENLENHKLPLSEIVNHLSYIWEIIDTNDRIQIKYVIINDPSYYSDISKAHIEAFQNSTDWKQHIQTSNNNPYLCSLGPIGEIILEHNVYRPLNDFLKTKGLKIEKVSGEKTSFTNKKALIKMGYKNPLIVPHKSVVWLDISLI